MIIGVGCDIVEHDTTKILKWESDSTILKRIFTNQEIEMYSQDCNLKFLAGRFAAKEAVLKCLGSGMQDGLSLRDIQIAKSSEGKPTLELFGGVRVISDSAGINSWHLSISHSKNHSIAFVIAENTNSNHTV